MSSVCQNSKALLQVSLRSLGSTSRNVHTFDGFVRKSSLRKSLSSWTRSPSWLSSRQLPEKQVQASLSLASKQHTGEYWLGWDVCCNTHICCRDTTDKEEGLPAKMWNCRPASQDQNYALQTVLSSGFNYIGLYFGSTWSWGFTLWRFQTAFWKLQMITVISSIAGSDLSQNNPGTMANISAIKMLLEQSEWEQMTNPVPE